MVTRLLVSGDLLSVKSLRQTVELDEATVAVLGYISRAEITGGLMVYHRDEHRHGDALAIEPGIYTYIE